MKQKYNALIVGIAVTFLIFFNKNLLIQWYFV